MYRKYIFLLLLLFVLVGSGLPALSWTEEDAIPFDLLVPKMLAAPSLEAEPVFVFPIARRLLAMTPDRKWYKVKIMYDLPLIGHFEYLGWCYAPIDEKLSTAKTFFRRRDNF